MLFNPRTKQYLGNSARVRASWKSSDIDKWIFNKWSVVGPNPIIFCVKRFEY
jgi:hypothetical protein